MTPDLDSRKTCRCGRGKASAYDDKCGHCRTQRERKAVDRMREGWPREAAIDDIETAHLIHQDNYDPHSRPEA